MYIYSNHDRIELDIQPISLDAYNEWDRQAHWQPSDFSRCTPPHGSEATNIEDIPELSLDVDEQESDIYGIEKILLQRFRNNVVEYFVRWTGYDWSHNSWVPSIHMHADISRLDFYARCLTEFLFASGGRKFLGFIMNHQNSQLMVEMERGRVRYEAPMWRLWQLYQETRGTLLGPETERCKFLLSLAGFETAQKPVQHEQSWVPQANRD